ncbi:MAG TPA: hypothetical protein PK523_08855, partial [Elusimicrobiales bacterium]|nr:hypothetical protein [Elusimicrobiales bacterium]
FNGYFDNYEEDLHTVADAIQNPIETISDLWNYGSGGDQLPIPNPPANPDPGNTHYDVHNDAGVAVHHNPWTGTSTQ